MKIKGDKGQYFTSAERGRQGNRLLSSFISLFLLSTSIIVLAIVNLLIGSVDIPLKSVCKIILSPLLLEGPGEASEIWQNIIWKSRLPQALTAMVAGAGLAVSGLQMQTVFRNPLAGPSVLGISNGSALGVAFVVLLSGRLGGVALSRLGYLGDTAMSVAAIVGALSVMLLIVWISQKVKGNVTLLIIGVMIGYLANAIIGVMKFLSPEEDVKAFVVWGLGSLLIMAATPAAINSVITAQLYRLNVDLTIASFLLTTVVFVLVVFPVFFFYIHLGGRL